MRSSAPYVLVALLPAIGLGRTSAIVAGVALLGLVVTLTMPPEPKGTSLEDFTERRTASSTAALGVSVSRGVRPPSA